MANNTNGKPVAEIRVGRIIAAIWQNTPTDDGVFYSVHITRLFRRGLNWDRTPAFGRDDLLTVAKVADLANTRIYELQNAHRIPQPAGRRRRRRRRLTHETAAAGPLPAAVFSVQDRRAPAGRTLEDRLSDPRTLESMAPSEQRGSHGEDAIHRRADGHDPPGGRHQVGPSPLRPCTLDAI